MKKKNAAHFVIAMAACRYKFVDKQTDREDRKHMRAVFVCSNFLCAVAFVSTIAHASVVGTRYINLQKNLSLRATSHT